MSPKVSTHSVYAIVSTFRTNHLSSKDLQKCSFFFLLTGWKARRPTLRLSWAAQGTLKRLNSIYKLWLGTPRARGHHSQVNVAVCSACEYSYFTLVEKKSKKYENHQNQTFYCRLVEGIPTTTTKIVPVSTVQVNIFLSKINVEIETVVGSAR